MFSSQQLLVGGFKQVTGSASPATHQQVRHFSRRRIAYPAYNAPKLGRTHKKDHRTTLRYQMQCFLGKKNYKGEYLENRYFQPPQDHRPNYIMPFRERGSPLVDLKTGYLKDLKGNVIPNSYVQKRRFEDSLQPFPHNEHCKTNLNLSKRDRERIHKQLYEDKVPVQQLAVDMGIKIPRLEATAKLVEIEKQWKKGRLVSPELRKMADTMYKMFPLFSTRGTRENLSEIPVPEKTLSSRFMTVAESEPFGPIEASKIYHLPPAVDLLKKAAEVGEHSESALDPETENRLKNQKYSAEHKLGRKKTDRYTFEFKRAKVGEVGFRYGTTLRDNKKDRKIDFDRSGKMFYALPQSG